MWTRNLPYLVPCERMVDERQCLYQREDHTLCQWLNVTGSNGTTGGTCITKPISKPPFTFQLYIPTLHSNFTFQLYIPTLHSNFTFQLYIPNLHSNFTFQLYITPPPPNARRVQQGTAYPPPLGECGTLQCTTCPAGDRLPSPPR